MSYYLPTRVPSYLLRLTHQYARTNQVLRDVICASRILVLEETGYDNWNGGQHGHDVRLYIPIEVLADIDLDDQLAAQAKICADLQKLAQSVEGEFFNAVQIEVAEDANPECQRASPFTSKVPLNPDKLAIWKSGHIRVFVSHRDQYKSNAHELADALEPYGLSCFVAHDTIPANEEWRRVILNGLATMEVMLVLLTDDFCDSVWTMQEVGYALGKGVPYVSLKVDSRDPPGFIGHTQALRGSMGNLANSAKKLVPLISNAVGRRERVQGALVAAFVIAPDWSETRIRFDRMQGVVESLTDSELVSIIDGWNCNDQLWGTYLTHRQHRRLREFLAKTTGRVFAVRGNLIVAETTF